MKFSIKDFFSKSFLQIWSHLIKKSLMEKFIFCAVKKAPSVKKGKKAPSVMSDMVPHTTLVLLINLFRTFQKLHKKRP